MRRFVSISLALLLLAVFAAFVWPTPWRFDHMTVDGNVVPVRIHRVTGSADMLLPDEGWVPVEAPADGSPVDPTTSRS